MKSLYGFPFGTVNYDVGFTIKGKSEYEGYEGL